MTKKRMFKDMIENNRWLKKVPNSLTICNSLCGFGAMVSTLNVYNQTKSAPETVFALSAWIILAAMIFDALDGFTARIFNAASMHGMQMDSLADMVTFGTAPAVVVAIMGHRLSDQIPYSYVIVWLLCAVYIGCAALRLATYNVHALLEKKSDDKFSGLPSPGAAAAICSLVIFYSMKDGEVTQLVPVLPIYAAFVGFLMVSPIRYAHMGKWIQSAKRSKLRLLILVAIIGALIWQPFNMFLLRKETQDIWFPQLFIVGAINLYVLSGPFTALLMKIGLVKKSTITA